MSSDKDSIIVGVKPTTCLMQGSVLTHALEARNNRELNRTIAQDTAKMVVAVDRHPQVFLTLAGEGTGIG
jgi:hypothetical protein